jgi:hypothetical protein
MLRRALRRGGRAFRGQALVRNYEGEKEPANRNVNVYATREGLPQRAVRSRPAAFNKSS